MKQIKVELIPSKFLTRRSCDLGGLNEKEDFLCEVTEGEFEGFSVAPSYLPGRRGVHPDVDADLEAAAVEAEEWAKKAAERATERAATYRALKGRLILPTYEEYNAARSRHWEERLREELASRSSWLNELKQMKAEGCDVEEEIEHVESDIAGIRSQLLEEAV